MRRIINGKLERREDREPNKIFLELSDLLKENEDKVVTTWIERLENYSRIYSHQSIQEIMDCLKALLTNYIFCFNEGNIEGVYISGRLLADKLYDSDVTYGMLINLFEGFEESCNNMFMNELSKLGNNLEHILKHQLLLNKINRKLFYIFLERFSKVKDKTILALAKMAEFYDPETSKHLMRTREYAALLAKQLNLGGDQENDIYLAGPLHDIGKVGIRQSILLKQGKLTKEEYEEMKKHTVIGKELILQTIGKEQNSYFNTAMEIILYHHEKYDGTGYPEGLTGDRIPYSARIFAVADAYDAIVSKRPYKDAMPHEEAVKIIRVEAGHHFDPKVVRAFMNVNKGFLHIKNIYDEYGISETKA